MRVNRRHALSPAVTVVAVIALSLIGCGVSGKTGDTSAAPFGEPKVTSPKTTDTTAPDTSAPDTSEPDTTEPDTTEPDTTEPDTSTPDGGPTTSTPFNTGDLRQTYLGILKRAGLSDKEANCVVKLIFKNGGGTLDPNATDFSKLGSQYLKCLGPDGVPGGG